jgi:hypothetical protein
LADADSWVQTSYNTRGGKHYDPETGNESADQTKALRKNFAGIGFKYDGDRDAFIPPRPFASWNLVEDTCWWEAPIAQPELTQEQIDAGSYYIWDEDTYQADNTQGWVIIESV